MNIINNMAIVDKINNVNLAKFGNEVVLLSQDSTIENVVTFEQHVKVRDILSLDGDMLTEHLMGIDLETWKKNAVFINKGKIHGK